MEKTANRAKQIALSVCALLILVVSAFSLAACGSYKAGGISAGNCVEAISNGVDSSALKVEAVKPGEGFDYAVKFTGSVDEVSQEVYDYWFNGYNANEKGRILVCVKLDVDSAISQDANATITLEDPKTESGKKEVKLADCYDSAADATDKFTYIIFNTADDAISTFSITYTPKDATETKTVAYSLDFSGVDKKVVAAE